MARYLCVVPIEPRKIIDYGTPLRWLAAADLGGLLGICLRLVCRNRCRFAVFRVPLCGTSVLAVHGSTWVCLLPAAFRSALYRDADAF